MQHLNKLLNPLRLLNDPCVQAEIPIRRQNIKLPSHSHDVVAVLLSCQHSFNVRMADQTGLKTFLILSGCWSNSHFEGIHLSIAKMWFASRITSPTRCRSHVELLAFVQELLAVLVFNFGHLAVKIAERERGE